MLCFFPLFLCFFFLPQKSSHVILLLVGLKVIEQRRATFIPCCIIPCPPWVHKKSNHTNRIFRFGFGKICVIFLDSYSKAKFGSYFRFGFEGKIRVIFQIRIRDSDSVYENIQIRIRDSRFGFLLKILDSDSRFGFGLCKYLDSDSRFAESCESANLKIRES